MACLENSHVLEQRLLNINTSEELKLEISRFIQLQHPKCTGKGAGISNILYRNNLHYIEDNLNKPELIDELNKYKH